VEIAIDVSGTGTAAPVFQWQHNGIDIPISQNPSATTALLVLDSVETSHAGTYRVVVRGAEDVVVSGEVPLILDASFTRIRMGAIVTESRTTHGASWFDYDNDGFPDLFIAGAVYEGGSPNILFRNKKDGTFQRVLDTPFVRSPAGESYSGAPADFDNDGRQDLFLGHPYRAERNALYRAEPTGSWVQVSRTALPLRSFGHFDGAWADFDRDGYLDLLVSGWSDTAGLALYRNQGDGSFAAMTSVQAGELLSAGLRYTRGPWLDLDLDGDPDLLLNVNGSGFQVFKNDGTGKFSRAEGGSLTGFAGWGSMRCADFDNDGYPDVFIGNWDLGGARLHRNLAGNGFADVTASAGVGGHHSTGAWGDYDNDGHLDLFAVSRDGPNTLYRNRGDGTFAKVDVGSPVTDGSQRVGAYWVNYDRDGFLDLHLACGDGFARPDHLYRNRGNANHWIRVQLVGTRSNRDAIGAKVRVQATVGGRRFWQTRELSGNSSFSDGQPREAHFGLGDATQVEVLRVEWPSGIVHELEAVTVDQFLTLREQPTLRIAYSHATGVLQLDCLGSPGTRYQLQTTADLVEWHPLHSWTTDAQGEAEHQVSLGSVPMRYFRTVEE
jgi:hypothetical protein